MLPNGYAAYVHVHVHMCNTIRTHCIACQAELYMDSLYQTLPIRACHIASLPTWLSLQLMSAPSIPVSTQGQSYAWSSFLRQLAWGAFLQRCRLSDTDINFDLLCIHLHMTQQSPAASARAAGAAAVACSPVSTHPCSNASISESEGGSGVQIASSMSDAQRKI